MNDIFKILKGIIVGLFFTCAFIGVCLLGMHFSDVFGWSRTSLYLSIIVGSYSMMFGLPFDDYRHYTKADTIIGAIVTFVIIFICAGKEAVPLGYYFLINSVIGINIILTSIKEAITK